MDNIVKYLINLKKKAELENNFYTKIISENDIQFTRNNDVDDFIQEELTLEEYNSRIIKWYLNKYNNNVLQVADKLDVGKSTIYRMLKEGKI